MCMTEGAWRGEAEDREEKGASRGCGLTAPQEYTLEPISETLQQ